MIDAVEWDFKYSRICIETSTLVQRINFVRTNVGRKMIVPLTRYVSPILITTFHQNIHFMMERAISLGKKGNFRDLWYDCR